MSDPNAPKHPHVPVHDEEHPEPHQPAGQPADYRRGPDVPFKGERPGSRVSTPGKAYKSVSLGCLILIVLAIVAMLVGAWFLYVNSTAGTPTQGPAPTHTPAPRVTTP